MTAIMLGSRRVAKSDTGNSKSAMRPDIQGLRALAVLLVIADHMVEYPTGGFIGVDVFFVISGFLITGHLIREQQKRGRISFADFYRRRAKRILPLAIFVLAVTVAATWGIFTASRALRVSEDAVWSLLFSANWHLAIIGTDYMRNDGVVSPLQHFWSLAVEEQFYVVWPWIVVLVMGLAAARFNWSITKSRAVLAVVMSLLTLCSLAFALWETANAPTVAYFSTFSRAWELGAGALLATAAPALAKIPAAMRPFIGWLGLGGILVGAFLITPEMSFPGPWAAFPVVASALVIAAGTGHKARYLVPLTNPVAGYLGNISYSLYLWHFPAIILLSALWPLDGPLAYANVLAVILTLSVWSYHFVETPARKDGWLRRKHKGRRHLNVEGDLTRARLGALTMLAMLTVGMGIAAFARTAPIEVAYAPSVSAQSTADAAAPTTAVAALASKVAAALATPVWPELSPSIDDLGPSAKAPEWFNDGCLGGETKSLSDPVANAERCLYGSPAATKTAMLIGDSMAISYLPGIRAALEPQGYKILVYTMQQCPAVSVPVLRADKSPFPECDAFRDVAFKKLKETVPDKVFMINRHQQRLASGASGAEARAEWMAGTKMTLAALSADAGEVVVMDAPPGGTSWDSCATAVSTPKDCQSVVSGQYKEFTGDTQEAASGVAKVRYVNTLSWFCAGGVACPAFVGTTPVYADGSHLSAAYSASLGSLIADALAGEL